MQGFWKETTVELPDKEEFNYIIKNEDTNCVIIRNSVISNLTAGIKPGIHDVTIAPGQVGVVARPFPLEHVYLFAAAKMRVSLIETTTKDPVDNYMQQEIARYDRNARQFTLEPLIVHRTSVGSALDAVLDTGIYGRPVVNIYLDSSAAADFWVDVSNDNLRFFRRTTISITAAGGGEAFHSFNNNAFRYIRVSTMAANNNVIVIAASR